MSNWAEAGGEKRGEVICTRVYAFRSAPGWRRKSISVGRTLLKHAHTPIPRMKVDQSLLRARISAQSGLECMCSASYHWGSGQVNVFLLSPPNAKALLQAKPAIQPYLSWCCTLRLGRSGQRHSVGCHPMILVRGIAGVRFSERTWAGQIRIHNMDHLSQALSYESRG